MKSIVSYIACLFALCCLTAQAQLDVRWTSSGILAGEQNIIIVISPPKTELNFVEKYIPGASVRVMEQGYTSLNSGEMLQFNVLQISIDAPGQFVLPPLDFRADNGSTFRTPPHPFTVYKPSDIQWTEIPNTGGAGKIGVLWHPLKKNPYVHEAIPCELKIYTNRLIAGFASTPIITPLGATASRFIPTYMRTNRIQPIGTALISGENWMHTTFAGSITPIHDGEITIPATIDGLAISETNQGAFYSARTVKIPLVLSSLRLQAQPLPAGAPAGFSNAVGRFQMQATTDALDLSLNEPINVRIMITGEGITDSMSVPKLQDETNWKLYPATRKESEDNTYLEFTQMIRPTAETAEIPPFSLTYFDPEEKTYKTLSTKPIPLPWKSSLESAASSNGGVAPAVAPPPGQMPIEHMTDIYGPIPEGAQTRPSMRSLTAALSSPWMVSIYAIPLALVMMIALRAWKSARAISAQTRAIMYELKSVSRISEESSFLRGVGNIITTHIPQTKMTEELQDILHTRDTVAFNPNHEMDKPIDPQQKKQMLYAVKKALSHLSVLLLAAVIAPLCLSQSAEASQAETFYAAKEYTSALNTLQSMPPTANTLYDIGNCYYKLNRPGMAALYYRKALEQSPSFLEAQKNLAFIERKEGALYPPQSRYDEWLTYIPYKMLPGIIHLTLALGFSAIFCICLWHRRVLLLSIVTGISLLTSTAALYNYAYYPITPESIPHTQLLVVTQATPGYPYIDEQAPPLMTLTPSTPLILKADRGKWLYTESFTGTPMWVLAENARRVKE